MKIFKCGDDVYEVKKISWGPYSMRELIRNTVPCRRIGIGWKGCWPTVSSYRFFITREEVEYSNEAQI